MDVLDGSNRAVVLARIEALVVSLLRQLAHQPVSARGVPLRLEARAGAAADAATTRALVFPTRAASGVRRFAQYLRVLSVVQANLVAGRVVTKREVFYMCTELFSTQRASDLVIDRLAQMLGCARQSLGVVASTRGLLCGSLTLHSPTGRSVVCIQGEVQHIPPETSAAWSVELHCAPSCAGHVVLVVEKAGVLQRLVDLAHHAAWSSVVVVTACGYADVATRELVRLLATAHCTGRGVSICGLFDGDPYGIDIHLHYTATIPVKWIGIDPTDFTPDAHTHTPLRADERSKAVQLLRSAHLDSSHRARLTHMLLDGYKVQIDATYHAPGGLQAYLEPKLFGPPA